MEFFLKDMSEAKYNIFPLEGSIAIASAIKASASNIFLAWGNGYNSQFVSVIGNLLVVSPQDTIVLSNTSQVDDVVAKSSDGAITYVRGVDYEVDEVNGIFTRLPTGAIPELATLKLSYITVPYVPSTSTETLVNEIGRRQVSEISYLTPDANGSVIMASGSRFSKTNTPSRFLYFNTVFDNLDGIDTDGVGETITEYGLFIGVTRQPSVPAGKYYISPSEVLDSGRILAYSTVKPIIRQNITSPAIQIVIPF